MFFVIACNALVTLLAASVVSYELYSVLTGAAQTTLISSFTMAPIHWPFHCCVLSYIFCTWLGQCSHVFL